jgi:drug/metabolite transporter (DMT)-like permease
MNRFIYLLIAIFILLAGCLWALRQSRPEFDFPLLTAGNALLAGLTAVSYVIVQRSIMGRPQAFIGGVYAGTMLKLLVVGGGLLVYILMNREHVHKPSLMILAGLYLVYTVAEKLALQRVARRSGS